MELTRRYTLVNLKRHRLWVSDGSRALELPPHEPKAYHPNNSDAEFHLDISAWEMMMGMFLFFFALGRGGRMFCSVMLCLVMCMIVLEIYKG